MNQYDTPISDLGSEKSLKGISWTRAALTGSFYGTSSIHVVIGFCFLTFSDVNIKEDNLALYFGIYIPVYIVSAFIAVTYGSIVYRIVLRRHQSLLLYVVFGLVPGASLAIWSLAIGKKGGIALGVVFSVYGMIISIYCYNIVKRFYSNKSFKPTALRASA